MAFCDNCGHELRPTAKFCGKCGTHREPIDDTTRSRSRERTSRPRMKSREEELAEYEEEYISRSEDTGSKQNVNSGKVLQRPPEWKSMGVTMVLTVVLGIVGLGGIGHIYLGKIIKGIVLCIVGIILLVFTIKTVLMGLVILIPFALIVVYDTYRLCKRYNNDLEQTGRPPW